MKKIIIYTVILAFLIISLSACRRESPTVEESTTPTEVQNLETIDIYIPSGGSIFSEMTKIGLTPIQIVEMTNAFGDKVGFRSIQPNDHFQVVIDRDNSQVMEFNYLPDIVTIHKVVKNTETGEFEYILQEKETTTRLLIVEGVVYTTLDQALIDKKVDNAVRHAVTNGLSSRINFSAYTRQGDTFKILYEERYLEGVRISGSRLFYMSYNGRATGFQEGFRYSEADDKSAYNGFYTPTGVAMVTSSFRWPLDRIHVTSPFGNRFHPISRTRQMHSGVDYRGAIGTPIYAVAAGRVIRAGANGGFGNTVEIQHTNGYVTQYAHMHRIRVRNGQNVTRGTVVGTVGNTGYTTGPHLHFGLRVGGRWINPSNIRMVAAFQLEGKRLDDLKDQVQKIRDTLEEVEKNGLNPFELTPSERLRRANAQAV